MHISLKPLFITKCTWTGQIFPNFSCQRILLLSPKIYILIFVTLYGDGTNVSAAYLVEAGNDESKKCLNEASVWWTFRMPSGKLLGMNETSATVTMATANTSSQAISKQVLSVANVGVVSSSPNDLHRWALLASVNITHFHTFIDGWMKYMLQSFSSGAVICALFIQIRILLIIILRRWIHDTFTF